MIIIKLILNPIFPKLAIIIPKYFHKLIKWLINLSINIEGKIPECEKGIIFVSNHISYLDIPVLGSILSAKFVSKAEVSKWIIIGLLARIGNTIFIKRNKKNLYNESNFIFKEIVNGFDIIIFPEGTTSDGIRILKFKSSLFSPIENKDFYVQPIVIKYNLVDGFPLNRRLKPIIAWYGNMPLIGHLKRLLDLTSISVNVKFLNPINAKDFKNRKSMTFQLQNVINKHYSENY